MDNGKPVLDEVYRFPNQMDDSQEGLIWDVERLFVEVKRGIAKAFQRYPRIESVAIDTWGVDYVLIDKDGRDIKPCFAYRNERMQAVIDKVHAVISPRELYSVCGIQFQPFNTIYQLYCDKLAGRLDNASSFLMMPEYLNYRLTGVMMSEYTNATTTGLVNATAEYDLSFTRRLGYPDHLFNKLHAPSTEVGELSPEVAREVGGTTKVVLCASHDTASAFACVDTDANTAFLSSGTWSLLGVKLQRPVLTETARIANFSNEGGIGCITFLKNITGMWLNLRLKEEFNLTYDQMVDLARGSSYDKVFDANDSSFMAPDNMRQAIIDWYVAHSIQPPTTPADIIRSVYLSLADSYRIAVEDLEKVTGQTIHSLVIVGGGAKNALLNELTATALGRKIVPMPIEATSIGNIKAQI